MSRKSNPYSLRLGINQTWQSYYFAPRLKQANWLKQDKIIRDYLLSQISNIIQVKIERTETDLIIFVNLPNVSLATEGEINSEKILQKIVSLVDDKKISIKLHLIEVKEVYSSAQWAAKFLAQEIEKRTPFRLACKNILSKINEQRGVEGVKIRVSGRLDGNEIARGELFRQGKMPLSTLNGNTKFSFGKETAKTTYGKIGITIWICLQKEIVYQKERNYGHKKPRWRDKNYLNGNTNTKKN